MVSACNACDNGPHPESCDCLCHENGRPSGLLEGQTDPATRAMLRGISAGLRARYGTLPDTP